MIHHPLRALPFDSFEIDDDAEYDFLADLCAEYGLETKPYHGIALDVRIDGTARKLFIEVMNLRRATTNTDGNVMKDVEQMNLDERRAVIKAWGEYNYHTQGTNRSRLTLDEYLSMRRAQNEDEAENES